jgi:hypothetical protein
MRGNEKVLVILALSLCLRKLLAESSSRSQKLDASP